MKSVIDKTGLFFASVFGGYAGVKHHYIGKRKKKW